MKLKVRVKASIRLFASGHTEAGKALKEVAKILGPHFVTNEEGDNQAVIWRSPAFKAVLALDTDNETIAFSFRDKGNAGGFDAEGYNASELFKDIRYNVTQFKPTKQLDPKIAEIRNKFESIQ